MRAGLLLALLAPCVGAQSTRKVRELGDVDFARDLDAVLAARPEKPIFLQFQEVPG